jgi:hypothetical protein
MGILTTVAALQALHATISGVTSAPTARPEDVKPAALPCVIVRPGALTVGVDARQMAGKQRAYEGVVLVVAPNQGRGISEGLARSHTLMDAFAAFYEGRIEGGTDLSTGGIIVGYRDGGEPAALLGYGASDFEGFTFTVDVWEG